MDSSEKKEIQSDLSTYGSHRIILWGAGIYGKKILEKLAFFSISVEAFCDNNQALWGSDYEGIPVISPDTLKSKVEDTSQREEILVQIALFPNHENYQDITNAITTQLKELGVTQVYPTKFIIDTVFYLAMMKELKLTFDEAEQLIKSHYLLKPHHERITFLVEDYKKLIPQKPLHSFILNIVDHCNLNCQRCDHFSPIADSKFVSVESVEADMKQMSFLLGGSVAELKVEGGEALMHPDLLEILTICRKYFPKTKLLLMTNGVLLLKQAESFWDCCQTHQVVMSVTKYPVNFDYEKAEQVAHEHQVGYVYFGGDMAVKTSYKLCLDERKSQDPMGSFLHCHRANTCLYLMEGKFYLCPTVSNVQYLNKQFSTEFQVDSKDYLDIYQVKSAHELTEFVAKPSPFCGYCQTATEFETIPWAVTKKKREEWL